MGIQIKSRERVKELAEVYTNEREVNSMLDLIEESKSGFTYDIKTTFLEPACGNGNFIIKILERKLETVKKKSKTVKSFEINTLVSISTIYGIDICYENVSETKKRIKTHLESYFYLNFGGYFPTKEWFRAIDYILDKNIILGNTLEDQEKIKITEFIYGRNGKFKEKIFKFSDLTLENPTPIEEKKAIHYEKWSV